MASATLLLPPAARFGKQGLGGPGTAKEIRMALGRADRAAHAGSDRRAQLLRHFDVMPAGWPIAALTREAQLGDAGTSCWLRADPAYVRPDINGARLMAYGDALALDEEDAAALLPALQPLFESAGYALEATQPSHWLLRLPRDTTLPVFTDPDRALGEDVFDHLAEGDSGRPWRALLSEAQVVLHNHPWNSRRAARGKPPVNAMWFWGGGVLPDEVRTSHATVSSDDQTAAALAHACSVLQPLPPSLVAATNDALFDLANVRDAAQLIDAWLLPALAAIRAGKLRRLQLDFEDGQVFVIERRHRWRLLRKPLAAAE